MYSGQPGAPDLIVIWRGIAVVDLRGCHSHLWQSLRARRAGSHHRQSKNEETFAHSNLSRATLD
jgi:hypothetical protein